MRTEFPSKHSYTRRILWKIVSIIRVIQHHKRVVWRRNSVRVVPLIAPRWRIKWAYVGNKWTHGINPERVQLFRILNVLGRSKTRTGFENHLLSLPRGWLGPRQPRAFKSTTRTELIVLPAFKKRYNTHHHRIIKGFQKHNCHAITTWKTSHRATQHPPSSYNQRLSKT